MADRSGRDIEMQRHAFYIQYTDPSYLPPLERSALLLKQEGWEVCFLGIKIAGHTSVLTPSIHAGAEREFMLHHTGGVRALRSYMRFWWRALQRVRREKPDVVYVSDVLSYPAGWLISLLCPTIMVQHEHDTPLVPSGLYGLLAPFRNWFIRRADLRINPQADRLRLVQETTGCGEIRLVYNCPSLTELPPNRSFDEKSDDLVLWHHGSIGPGQMPLSIVDALTHLPEDISFAFAGYETVTTKGYSDCVLARAKELGVDHRVTFHGAFPTRGDLYGEATKAHVGVALFDRRFREPMAGASNKPFDFLGCTMALLVNDTAEWTDFFVSRGVAAACNPEDAADIAAVINRLYEDRVRLAEMATEGRHLIETEWNYEVQFAPVLAELDALLDKRPH